MTKNLLSIAQWDEDKNDDYEIHSQGLLSIFYLNDYTISKKMPYRPDYMIPLMFVTDVDKSYGHFSNQHNDKLINSVAPLN